MAETKICPTCKGVFPLRHFRVYTGASSKVFGSCRVCRHRQKQRINARERAANERLKAKLDDRFKKNTEKQQRQESKVLHDILRSRFLKATSVTRQRIRIMSVNPEPTGITVRALTKRQEILARYEAAYAEQLRMVEAGVMPPDIEGMIC